MTRRGRLDVARGWLSKYPGRNVVRGYAKWFGVDLGCALKELQMLGVVPCPVYVARLRTTLQNPPRVAASAQEHGAIPEDYGVVWDDDFQYIAGFTSLVEFNERVP